MWAALCALFVLLFLAATKIIFHLRYYWVKTRCSCSATESGMQKGKRMTDAGSILANTAKKQKLCLLWQMYKILHLWSALCVWLESVHISSSSSSSTRFLYTLSHKCRLIWFLFGSKLVPQAYGWALSFSVRLRALDEQYPFLPLSRQPVWWYTARAAAILRHTF